MQVAKKLFFMGEKWMNSETWAARITQFIFRNYHASPSVIGLSEEKWVSSPNPTYYSTVGSRHRILEKINQFISTYILNQCMWNIHVNGNQRRWVSQNTIMKPCHIQLKPTDVNMMRLLIISWMKWMIEWLDAHNDMNDAATKLLFAF